MQRLFVLVVLLAAVSASGQLSYQKVNGDVGVRTPYNRKADLAELNIHTNFSTLAGEQLYFAKRCTLPDGSADSMPDLDGFARFRACTFDEILLPWQHSILKHKTPVNIWSFIYNPALRPGYGNYAPGTDYQVFTYRPSVILDSRNRTISVNTPYREIEDRFFDIVDCRDSANNGMFCYLVFTLRDDAGELIRWTVYTREISKSQAHIVSYLTTLRHDLVGSTYYVRPRSQAPSAALNIFSNSYFPLVYGRRYLITDLIFVDSKFSVCALPYLIFADSSGAEFTIWPGNSKKQPTGVASLSHFASAQELKATADQIGVLADSLEDRYLQQRDSIRLDSTKRMGHLVRLYGKKTAQKLMNGMIELGMTKYMCRAAWGDPFIEMASQKKEGLQEVWKYAVNRWLKFVNGKLVAYSQ